MALRNQPYLPLYVQDFLTDEKLIECSAEATGVYIRLMCIFHKSDEYGCILLKQKDKQTDSTIKNFALKISKQMPYDIQIVEHSLKELLEEKVLILEEDILYQKRMRNDGILSDKKAEAGKKGAEKRYKNNENANDFAIANDIAKHIANTEYEIEYENVSDNKSKKEKKGVKGEEKEKEKKTSYAEFVTMTNVEYEKLVNTYGEEFTRRCIEVLDNYKGANGKKYKNDYRAILNWVVKKVTEDSQSEHPQHQYISYQERKKIEEDKMWEDLKKKVESEKK